MPETSSRAVEECDTASPEETQVSRRVAQRRVLWLTLLLFSIIACGAAGCLALGVVEVLAHDTILMNQGLGVVMTVLGLYFLVLCVVCAAAFCGVRRCHRWGCSFSWQTRSQRMAAALCFLLQHTLLNSVLWSVYHGKSAWCWPLDALVATLIVMARPSSVTRPACCLATFMGKWWVITVVCGTRLSSARWNVLVCAWALTAALVPLLSCYCADPSDEVIPSTDSTARLVDEAEGEGHRGSRWVPLPTAVLMALLLVDVLELFEEAVAMSDERVAPPLPLRCAVAVVAGVVYVFASLTTCVSLLVAPPRGEAAVRLGYTDVGSAVGWRALQYLHSFVVIPFPLCRTFPMSGVLVYDVVLLVVRATLLCTCHIQPGVFFSKNVMGVGYVLYLLTLPSSQAMERVADPVGGLDYSPLPEDM